MKRVLGLLTVAILIVGIAGGANAALWDRGGGLIYDDVLDITWLQDANYAKTSRYDSDGLMTWAEAMTWADSLVYRDSIRGVDYDDWRLPTTFAGPFAWGYDGTTTAGYNITSSEMGYMYYTNLGNKGFYATGGTWSQSGWGLQNTGPFTNLQSYYYWSGTEYSANPDDAWYFVLDYGYQSVICKDFGNFYAWAVRPGDVSAIPLPGAVWMLGSGLACAAALRRKFGRRLG